MQSMQSIRGLGRSLVFGKVIVYFREKTRLRFVSLRSITYIYTYIQTQHTHTYCKRYIRVYGRQPIFLSLVHHLEKSILNTEVDRGTVFFLQNYSISNSQRNDSFYFCHRRRHETHDAVDAHLSYRSIISSAFEDRGGRHTYAGIHIHESKTTHFRIERERERERDLKYKRSPIRQIRST